MEPAKDALEQLEHETEVPSAGTAENFDVDTAAEAKDSSDNGFDIICNGQEFSMVGCREMGTCRDDGTLDVSVYSCMAYCHCQK